ncbi:MAG TPA: hypothetical protein VKT52_09325 [Ktedonobacterales bacterium]|nr:hypothetical protein [Ktedonobacterales bacterium]
MNTDQGSYKAFRARLDSVLRQKNPEALRTFLIAEGQWRAEDTTDTEAAMWMMIATSLALRPMHDEAERWLLTHGHETEASAIFGGRRKPTSGKPTAGAGGPRKPHKPASSDGRPRTPPSQRPKRTPPPRRP